MTDSTHLALPFLDQAQAQKHVTHNEALRVLDGLVQASVLDRDLAAPPGSPAAGARYLVAAGASGAFAGHAGEIAHYEDGAWRFHAPRAGWRVHVADEGVVLIYTGAAWIPLGHALGAVENIASLGLGTTSDATNAFAAKLRNALFAAKTPGEGGDGDIQIKLVKTALADVASLLFQSNYSGRAETGLIGDDAFRVKVSSDGAAWFDGVSFDPATGKATFPNGAEAPAGLVRTDEQVFTASGTWTKPAWAQRVCIAIAGAGGGGGSGAAGDNTASRFGGGGGGAGGHAVEEYLASELAATLSVTVGAGGAGGTGVTGNTTGATGGTGGTTSVSSAGVTILSLTGGVGGGGGTTTAGAAGGGGFGYPSSSNAGGASSVTGNGGTGLSLTNVKAPGGGGAGGGIDTSSNARNGGGGGDGHRLGGSGGFAAAAGFGGAAGGNGGAGAGKGWARGAGGGGGGGGASTAANAGSGGAGGAPGGGGGGGAAARNAFTSGAGGAGSRGEVVIVSIG